MTQDPNVLVLLYDQVPPIIRILLAAFSLGALHLAWSRWKKNEEKLQDIEQREQYYITREEFKDEMQGIRREAQNNFDRVHRKLDDLTKEVFTHVGQTSTDRTKPRK